MKVQSFEYLRTAYDGYRDLAPDDLEERKKLLNEYKYSVIIECEHMEYDNLHKWIKQNLQTDLKEIYYGKTNYDYGFVEFFLSEKMQEEKLRSAVPNIYTTYPFQILLAKSAKVTVVTKTFNIYRQTKMLSFIPRTRRSERLCAAHNL